MLTHRSIRREVGCTLGRFLFLPQRSQRDTKPKTNLESPINLSPQKRRTDGGFKPTTPVVLGFCSKAPTLKYCQHINLFIQKLKYFTSINSQFVSKGLRLSFNTPLLPTSTLKELSIAETISPSIKAFKNLPLTDMCISVIYLRTKPILAQSVGLKKQRSPSSCLCLVLLFPSLQLQMLSACLN